MSMSRIRSLTMALALPALLFGCDRKPAPSKPPTPQVAVIKLAATPTTFTEEYVGQTEAVDAVEIRSRVSGLLDRQGFVDGTDVQRGQLLFVIDSQPFMAAIAQAKASLAQARAASRQSHENLLRARPLFEDGALSREELDTAIAKEATDAGAIKVAAAQLREAEINFGYTEIRAPRSGMMGKALIKNGGLINASTTLLATFYSVDPMNVGFAVSEPTLVALQHEFGLGSRGGLARVPTAKIKLIDDTTYKYDGKLDYLDPAVDPRNGTLQMRITVPNPDRMLRAGQFVRVVMPVRHNANAIHVPQKAVQELQGQQSVLVVAPDNTIAFRRIIAKTRVGDEWIVEQGLTPGELLVVEGTAKLKPGTAVQPVLASGNAPSPAEAKLPGQAG